MEFGEALCHNSAVDRNGTARKPAIVAVAVSGKIEVGLRLVRPEFVATSHSQKAE